MAGGAAGGNRWRYVVSVTIGVRRFTSRDDGKMMVGSVGFEPTTYRLKGGYSNQLSYEPDIQKWRSLEDLHSNPC